MGLESIYRLSVVVNMIDNLTNPLNRVSGSTSGALDKMSQGYMNLAKSGAGITTIGVGITSMGLNTVKSTFETKNALGELKSLGVEDLKTIEEASRKFSDTWAGTTKADFISAAYDIKSGISTLSDEGVAQFTDLSGLTAKATKSTIGEMTSLFATGYGIYKDYYSGLSDMEFGEMFSAGISESVRAFKTAGSEMAASISTLGASATTAQVPLEEQLSILGMLQSTMSGSEAGTKYKAFLAQAAGAGKKLKLSFMDANNQLLSMPEILGELRGKYGDTIDAMEKQELKEAFGTDEAVALIDLLYGKTDALQDNILNLYDKMGSGSDVATKMATAINSTESQKYDVLKQRLHNVSEEIGAGLLPMFNQFLDKAGGMLTKISDWIGKNQETTASIMKVVMYIGIFLTVMGASMTIIGGLGLAFTKTIGFIKGFITAVKGVKSGIETIRIYGMLAGDSIKAGFGKIKGAASSVVSSVKSVGSSVLSFAKTAIVNGAVAVKNFVLSLVGMAKQAITTAVTALPGLIASVWGFTSALLANPITWIVVGIIALIAGIILLWQNWDKVSNFINTVWNACVARVGAAFQGLKNKFSNIMSSIKTTISSGINAVVTFFKQLPSKIVSVITSLPSKIKGIFTKMISGAKGIITGAISWFGQSGSKIMSTFANGIKNAISKPVEMVKSGLSKIRKMLPFSDAKEGPLSTLTLSGKRVFETINTGMNKTIDLPSKTTKKALGKVKTEFKGTGTLADELKSKKKPKSTSHINDTSIEKTDRKTDNSTYIENINIKVDITKLKDLEALYKLIDDLKGNPKPETA